MLFFLVSCLFRCVLFFFEIFWELGNGLYWFISGLFNCVSIMLFLLKILWKLDEWIFSVRGLFCFLLFCFVAGLLQKPSGVVVEKPKPMPENDDDNNNAPQTETKYDVFVSFRGEDVRSGFLSHLIVKFQTNKINFFVDDKLKKGEGIWPSLVRAIEESSISLIIFSPEYASSRWCLEEVEKIIECKEKRGQIVIPIFYCVNPTDVRHQRGSYKIAFDKHEEGYKTKVQLWRNALQKSANLSGFVGSEFRNDVDLLKQIVELVLTTLGNSPINSKGLVGTDEKIISKGLVGIDEKIANVESLIRKEPNSTRLIGIWGMGGIGKTTIANEIFNKLRYEYEGCYFLANEREESSRHGIEFLKREILSGLLVGVEKFDIPNLWSNDIDARRIGCMKVLIILDDVNDLDHLDKLLGSIDNFGSGSRIIITTRYKQVLNKAHEIYSLGEFTSDKALKLFKLNAFNQGDHPKEFDELSKRVVDYAKGIPLVLKVLAHLLRGKNKEVWKSELDKLEKMPLIEVYDVMKLSYDDLDGKEQQIFLDLACFFLGSHIMVNKGYLKSLLKDGESDNSVVAGLERLADKALITFSKNNVVSMHDSLQEMAWKIVRSQDYNKDHRSCNRLWDPNDIYEALKNDESTGSIRSIRIHLPTFKKQELSLHTFSKMKRLQFLEISGKCKNECFDQHNILAEGLQFLATELRFLCWYYYPLKSLPEDFSAEKLVILELPKGKIESLWHGVKNLVNLKQLDLTDSKMLKEVPDLSKATNLEVVLLGGCSMLTKVHPSIFSLAKLEKLNLYHCTSLTTLTSKSHLRSLIYLKLDKCEKLEEFLLKTDNIKELRLRWTKVKALSSSFGDQRKLKWLHLEGSDIKRLPSSIKDLMQLSHLNVRSCLKLQEIPKLPPSLKTLSAKNCSSLKTIQELPPSLKTLRAQNCTSLETVLFPSTADEQLEEKRKEVVFWNCLKLDKKSLEDIALNAAINVKTFANRPHDDFKNCNDYDKRYHSYQVAYAYPGSSFPEWLEYKTTDHYIEIDLSSSAPPSTFIFCFAFGNYGDTSLDRIEANIAISDGDSVKMYIGLRNGTIESDHICVMYDQRCSAFLNSRVQNKKKFKIEVRMVLRSSSKQIFELPQQMFKGFGFGLGI